MPNAYLPSAGCPLCRHISFDTCWVNACSKKLGKIYPTYAQFSFTQWSLPNISNSVCTLRGAQICGCKSRAYNRCKLKLIAPLWVQTCFWGARLYPKRCWYCDIFGCKLTYRFRDQSPRNICMVLFLNLELDYGVDSARSQTCKERRGCTPRLLEL